MKRILSRVLIALGLVLLAGEALAQQTVNINATVKKTCSVTNNTPAVSLLQYDPTSATAMTANGTMTVTCSKGTTYFFTVNDGTHFSGSRRLEASFADSSKDYLNYDFLAQTVDAASFSPGAFASVGTGSVLRTGDKSTGAAASMSFGFQISIPPGQDGATDVVTDYTDAVTVTVTY
jgi:spore coat protein U-like protein